MVVSPQAVTATNARIDPAMRTRVLMPAIVLNLLILLAAITPPLKKLLAQKIAVQNAFGMF